MFFDHSEIKLEINENKTSRNPQVFGNKTTLFWIILQSKKKSNKNFKNYLKANDNKTIYQNLWDIAKALFRVKYIALNAYIEKKSKINKISTNFTQNLSENREGKNTWWFILWGQHNPDTKIC